MLLGDNFGNFTDCSLKFKICRVILRAANWILSNRLNKNFDFLREQEIDESESAADKQFDAGIVFHANLKENRYGNMFTFVTYDRRNYPDVIFGGCVGAG